MADTSLSSRWILVPLPFLLLHYFPICSLFGHFSTTALGWHDRIGEWGPQQEGRFQLWLTALARNSVLPTVKVRVLSISPSPLSSSEPSICFSARTESTAVFCFKLWAECTCLRFPDTYNPVEDGECPYWGGNQMRGSHLFFLSLHSCCPKQNKGNQCNRGNPAQTSTPPNSQPCAWRWAPNEDDQKAVNSLLTLCSVRDLLPYFLICLLILSCVQKPVLCPSEHETTTVMQIQGGSSTSENKEHQPLQFSHIQICMDLGENEDSWIKVHHLLGEESSQNNFYVPVTCRCFRLASLNLRVRK